MKFTKPSVAALSCPSDKAEAFFWDESLPGFGLRCYASGRRVWFCQYRNRDGQTRRITLGDWRTVELEAARKAASAHLSTVDLGGDPRAIEAAAREAARAEKAVEAARADAERNAPTVGGIIGDYIKACTDGGKRQVAPRTLDAIKRVCNVQARALHPIKLEAVTRRDVVAVLEGIAVGVEGRKGAPIAANRARAHLSAMFAWAKRSGRMEAENPVSNTEPLADEKSRDRVLSDDEVALIWACTDTGTDYARIVRLLLLTAARREEVGAMRWGELAGGDGDRVWTLPAARAKNGVTHELPLGPLAIAQLPAARDKRDLVFGRGKGGGFSGWSKGKAELDVTMAAQLAEQLEERDGAAESAAVPWRLHDLRRTFATWASENDVEPHVVEAVLNHSSGAARRGVAGVYNRATYRTQKRDALARWSDHIGCLAAPTLPASRP